MFSANVTMRSLKNTDTGIDITVPSIQEVEAPLGGTSTEYEISILTILDLYKSHLHSKEDVIHFCIFKAYKEVEDFYDKVIKKFSNIDVPSIPKGRSISKFSVDDKRSSLDKFMQEVSRHKDICDSSLFMQFLGINKHRKSRSSISETFSELSLHDSGVSSPGSCDQSSQLSSQIEENSSQYNNIAKIESNAKDEIENGDPAISELFPKMKVRKSSKIDIVDEKPDVHQEFSSALPAEVEASERPLKEDLDLFEEVQKIKKEEKDSKEIDPNRSSHQGLFDSFEDDASILFLSPNAQSNLNKPSCKPFETASNTNKSSSSVVIKDDISDGEAPNLFTFQPEALTWQKTVPKDKNTNHLSSSIVLKEDISDDEAPDLFSFQPEAPTRQTVVPKGKNTKHLSSSVAMKEDISDGEAPDLFIFQPEAPALQPIAPKDKNTHHLFETTRLFRNEDEVDTKKQIPGEISLFEEQDFGSCISKEDEELFFVVKSDKSSVINTLLSPSTDSTPDDDGVTESLEELITLPEPSADIPKTEPTPIIKEARKLPPKPVPKPRVKSDLSSVAPGKPQVLPRKAFLSKPTLPPKPVPPPKPKPSVAARKQPEESAAVTENQKNTLDNLSSLDILQYIEQEEKIANSRTGLFD